MKTWKKILIIVGGLLVLSVIVGFTVSQSRKNVVAVQTSKIHREDLTSIVSASGQIKPLNYVNIGANAFGKITKLYVEEGDKVKRGQMLAQLENVQSAADVAAMKASVNASQMDADAALAGLNTAKADLKRAQADNERAKLDYDRAEGLFKQQLIAKADYDAKKAAYDTAAAGLVQAQARIAQAQAQYESSTGHIGQNQAQLTRAKDVLSKTTYAAPFDGTITNLPVREGETVVIGIQNAPGSTLMTLSDMSTITAEVMVDETDIVNVKMGQDAEVSIDAIPKKTFKAKVTQIGDIAMLRSTGVATSQSTGGSQEAKDFKVVVTLTEPPQNLRPGLSCTAKITTATRPSALAVPIQALTIRSEKDLQSPDKNKKDGKTVQAAAPEVADKQPQELQGVFVVRNGKADFVKIDIGVQGATDAEVTSGLKDGDEIVTGSYKVLRTLKNGASVKVDNTTVKKDEA
jgi:HlyD family secretion protein